MRVIVVRLARADLSQYLNRFESDKTFYLEAFTNRKKNLFYETVLSINNWYTRVLGLDEVKLYQQRVVALQERLLETQEKRREIGRHLTEIRQKSMRLQDELHKVNRQHDLERYLALMRDEGEVLRQEKQIQASFTDADQAEREIFTAFSNSIRDSYVIQRSQLEYTKYFGLILSIVGSFLTFCYTSFSKHDLKKYIEQIMDQKAIDKTSFTNELRKTFQAQQKTQNIWEQIWHYHPNNQNEKSVNVWAVAGGIAALFIVGRLIFG